MFTRKDRHDARMAALGFVRLQRHCSHITLIPRPGEQLARPDAGEAGRDEQRLQVIWQRLPQLEVLLIGQESLPGVPGFADQRQ